MVVDCGFGCGRAVALLGAPASSAQPVPPPPWTIHVVNDTCADTTWGFDEKATRRNMAELVRAHLDAMSRTDGEPEESRDRYTMAVTNEALAFLEHYPGRKDELVRRLREGRITLSPFLNNTLWGWQSEEAFLRSLYPARRLERAWGVPIDVAHHTELPSLPWGAASLLAGAGVRWLAIPFLDYDTEWGGLDLPPLFVLEGPDGGRVRVVLDAWASRRHNYAQGRALLEDPRRIGAEWAPRFEALGAAYPFRDVLALGTHGDLGPQSAGEVERFTAAIRDWNAQPAPAARLVNATLAGFCRAIDATEASRALPDAARRPRPLLGGLAGLARRARRPPRARPSARCWRPRPSPCSPAATRSPRPRASRESAPSGAGRCSATTRGTGRTTRTGARTRRSAAAGRTSSSRPRATWPGAPGTRSASRTAATRSPSTTPPALPARTWCASPSLPAVRSGRSATRTDAPSRASTSSRTTSRSSTSSRLAWRPSPWPTLGPRRREARRPRLPSPRPPTSLDGPFYRLTVDPRTGGLASLVHKPTGRELVVAGPRTLGQTVYFDGREAAVAGVESEVETIGPVLARLHVSYRTGPAETDLFVTLYAHVDRVDLDYRVAQAARSPSRSGSSTSSPSSPPARPCASTRPGR